MTGSALSPYQNRRRVRPDASHWTNIRRPKAETWAMNRHFPRSRMPICQKEGVSGGSSTNRVVHNAKKGSEDRRFASRDPAQPSRDLAQPSRRPAARTSSGPGRIRATGPASLPALERVRPWRDARVSDTAHSRPWRRSRSYAVTSSNTSAPWPQIGQT